MMGIRYFDIRVNADTPRLEIVHGDVAGSGNTGTYFDEMSTVFSDFLLGSRGLPSTGEIIVAQIKADKGSETGLHTKVVDILRTAFAAHLQVVYFDPIRRQVTDPNNSSHFDAIPTISTLRGRLVVIRRYELDQGTDPNALGSCTPLKFFASGADYNTWSQSGGNTSWKDYFSGRQFEWPDKGDNKSYFGGQLIDYRNINGLSFVVQDRYKGNPQYSDKYDLVEQYLEAANSGLSPDSWFLNFASCVYPGGGSEDINPRLQSYFASHTRNHGFGTILMDYVRPELVKTLIAANF